MSINYLQELEEKERRIAPSSVNYLQELDSLNQENAETPKQKDSGLASLLNNSLTRALSEGLNAYGKYGLRQAGALAAGMAEGGRGLLNLPAKAAEAISPKLGEKISPLPSYDFRKMFGVEDPNLMEELIEDVGSYFPSSFGGSAMLATKLGQAALKADPLLANIGKSLAEGGIYGVSMGDEEENLGENALYTGLLNAGIAALPGRGGAVLRAIKTLPENLAEQVSALKGHMLESHPEDLKKAFAAGKETLNKLETKEKYAWDESKRLAKEADEQLIPFNKNELVSSLQSKLRDLKKQAVKKPGGQKTYASSIDYLQNDVLFPLQRHNHTYEDMITFRQGLNDIYKKEFPKENKPSLDTLKYIKREFTENINKNIEEQGLSDFSTVWEEANALTKEKNKMLLEKNSKGGKATKSAFGRLAQLETPTNPESFISEYLPKEGEIGTDRFKQFEKIVGNPQEARQLLKAKLYGNVFESKGRSQEVQQKPIEIADKFFNEYFNRNKISAEQNRYLFTPREQDTIEELYKFYKKYPDELARNQLFKKWLGYTIKGHNFIPYLSVEGGRKFLGTLEAPSPQYITKALADELMHKSHKEESRQ